VGPPARPAVGCRGHRRRLSQPAAHPPAPARGRVEEWLIWTLGFEATGPASLLRSELEAAAALVFAQALPGGVELGIDDCGSYAHWLRQRAGTGG
jgi:hypothetical protein